MALTLRLGVLRMFQSLSRTKQMAVFWPLPPKLNPATPSTDHSREHVPLLVAGPKVKAGTALGTRSTFADLGQTLADVFGLPPLPHGSSFLKEIV